MDGVVGVIAIGSDSVLVKKMVEPRRGLRRIRPKAGDQGILRVGHAITIIEDETNSFCTFIFFILQMYNYDLPVTIILSSR